MDNGIFNRPVGGTNVMRSLALVLSSIRNLAILNKWHIQYAKKVIILKIIYHIQLRKNVQCFKGNKTVNKVVAKDHTFVY